MKTLILNTNDIQGGAAQAAYRLHTSLRRTGVDSKMLVDNKISDNPNVYGLIRKFDKAWSKIRPLLNEIPLKSYNWKKTPFYTGWIGRNITKEVVVKESDILNLHWIAGGFLSLNGISKFVKLSKPIVWTLHDMWVFTGGCHHADDCEKYTESCGACPQLNSNKRNDITREIWKRKKDVYNNLNLTIVTPSKWLAKCAKRSSLLLNSKIEVIPHGLDTEIYKPLDKMMVRGIFNLPENKKIILFGAVGGTQAKGKGFKYLKSAVYELVKMWPALRNKMCLLIFGSSHSEEIEEFPFDVKFLGRLSDDISLALAYNAADVFVGPSLREAFGQTFTEAISCGTPSVAFDYSGQKDIIDHKINGYLAEYKNSKSLAEGIKWVLEDENRRLALGEAAREKALREYSIELQAKRYTSLYENLLR